MKDRTFDLFLTAPGAIITGELGMDIIHSIVVSAVPLIIKELVVIVRKRLNAKKDDNNQ